MNMNVGTYSEKCSELGCELPIKFKLFSENDRII